jgi:hypothetical protein
MRIICDLDGTIARQGSPGGVPDQLADPPSRRLDVQRHAGQRRNSVFSELASGNLEPKATSTVTRTSQIPQRKRPPQRPLGLSR